MPVLQDIIHKLEVGGGIRYLKYALAVLAVLLLGVLYNMRNFRNFGTQEAMDSAQLARNLSGGKGYTTKFIRPFSMYLIKRTNEKAGDSTDLSMIRENHPDIANAPAYPVLLAGLMKIIPFNYPVTTTKPFWSDGGRFARYQPDFIIAIFNEVIFLGIIVATFFLARRLFDGPVAWLSAFLLLGTELFWRFAVSGLSTTFLTLVFIGLIWALVLLEKQLREPTWGEPGIMLFAALAGLLAGVGGLTRYSFGWLILPVVVFMLLFSTGPRRVILPLIAVAVFAAIMTPWMYRNFKICGSPFGTATFAVMENTPVFPGTQLERSLTPDFTKVGSVMPFWIKLLNDMRSIAQNDLPRLGGTWVTALFATGLLVGFRSPAIRRVRYFLLMAGAILFLAQAMGRTNLSDESLEINSENLLVIIVPLVIVYGVSLFYLLLEQIELQLPVRELRYGVIGGFAAVACLPMILAFLPPKGTPISYPYRPAIIQNIKSWMKENELIMSDMPWALAWYGDQQSVWLTLNATKDVNDPRSRETFFAISDYEKPVKGIYLTELTIDSRFLTDWIHADNISWGSFILSFVTSREAPPDFPLRDAPAGFFPEELFLADWKRWRQ